MDRSETIVYPDVRVEKLPKWAQEHIALLRRRLDLQPVSVGMAPEARVPAAIEFLQRTVTCLEPFTKRGFAQSAVAGVAVFVGNVPHRQRRMLSVALSHFAC